MQEFEEETSDAQSLRKDDQSIFSQQLFKCFFHVFVHCAIEMRTGMVILLRSGVVIIGELFLGLVGLKPGKPHQKKKHN